MKIKKNINRVFKITVATLTAISSLRVYAIDLNGKIQNTDKTLFNSISSPIPDKEGKSIFNFEYGNNVNPLVLKRNDGTVVPLIKGLDVFDASMTYQVSKSLQLGILVPGERPYGIVGPLEESKMYLSNIMVEAKAYVADGIAIIPVYYVPNSESISTNINNQNVTVPVGKEKGGYGLKASYARGKDASKEVITAFQVGAIMAPETKFREIDQSNRFQMGAGVSIPMTGTLRLLVEAYAEKTKNNNPAEALATIEYKHDSFLLKLGAGTGDLQGDGSNTSKVLAGFTYYFGEQKTAKAAPIVPSGESDLDFQEKVDKFRRQNIEEQNNAPQEEQNGPTSGRAPESFDVVVNDLLTEDRVVIPESTPIPVNLPEQRVAQEVFVYSERRKKLSIIETKETDSGRAPASVSSDNSSARIERAEKKIKRAILVMNENLELYSKAKDQKNQDEMDRLVVEFKWGIRVVEKNMDVLMKINHPLSASFEGSRIEEAQEIVYGNEFKTALEVTIPEHIEAQKKEEERMKTEHKAAAETQMLAKEEASLDQEIINELELLSKEMGELELTEVSTEETVEESVVMEVEAPTDFVLKEAKMVADTNETVEVKEEVPAIVEVKTEKDDFAPIFEVILKNSVVIEEKAPAAVKPVEAKQELKVDEKKVQEVKRAETQTKAVETPKQEDTFEIILSEEPVAPTQPEVPVKAIETTQEVKVEKVAEPIKSDVVIPENFQDETPMVVEEKVQDKKVEEVKTVTQEVKEVKVEPKSAELADLEKEILKLRAEKEALEAQVKAEQEKTRLAEEKRVKDLKEQELEIVDKMIDSKLEGTNLLIQESEKDKKVVPASDQMDQQPSKDGLYEKDGMEAQNGPVFN